MDILSIKNALISVLNNEQASEIQIFDVAAVTNLTDWMLIATANSQPHLRHLVTAVKASCLKLGVKPLHIADDRTGWSIIDLGQLMIHLMLDNERKFYSLEKLWTTMV